MNTLKKSIAALLAFIPFLLGTHLAAQTSTLDFRHTGVPQNDPKKPFTEIYRDTIDRSYSTTEIRDSVLDPLRVVTNRFGNNWFVFGTAGAHTFQGDYSSTSKFSGTISTDWSVGLGKWFTPGLALKLEFIRSKSQGYTQYLTGHYGTGPIQLNDKNIPFRNMETAWWDISGSVILNFTRLFYGYEGYNDPRRMNQIMGAFGFGGVHHLGYEHSHGSDNEWAGHVEVQYSRFFTRAKRFSLDLKLRGIFYQTNFDLEYGAYDGASNKWDCNLGVDLGFTYYLGKKRGNSWSSAVTQVYRRDFRQQDVLVYRERVDTVIRGGRDGTLKTLTFYVFYPNNYSGRNDAPIVSNANVNAIDYLLGGIFTQKKYNDAATVAAMLSSGVRTTQQPYSDIPTEPATNDFTIDCVQRGYEMNDTKPLSLSMMPVDMDNFYNQAGYFYAPIWDGLHEWHYRIDDATLKQQLVSSANYFEKETYGLNAHSGIPILLEHMDSAQGDDCLVSFADVYAALNGNQGFIANYTNPETVKMIRDIFRDGYITVIEAHGVATSQDNYSGENANKVGLERNKSLADSRAKTVVKWLKGTDVFNETKSIIYIGNGFTSAINKVSDPSTRGLNAKLNRCVKVRIQVIY